MYIGRLCPGSSQMINLREALEILQSTASGVAAAWRFLACLIWRLWNVLSADTRMCDVRAVICVTGEL